MSTEHRLAGPGHWWLGHTVGGVVGVIIALSLVKGPTPPRYPLVWMRVNLLILLLVIFVASATRHFRLRATEQRMFDGPLPVAID